MTSSQGDANLCLLLNGLRYLNAAAHTVSPTATLPVAHACAADNVSGCGFVYVLSHGFTYSSIHLSKENEQDKHTTNSELEQSPAAYIYGPVDRAMLFLLFLDST